MRMKGLFVAIALVAAPTLASAQHEHPPANAAVDFGVLPAGPTGVLVPIGPLPCLQSGAIGGPNDPCSYKLHVLTPEETTIAKGGQVTFQIHGGGHGFAIYEVSKDTTREDLGQFLCAGPDPEEIAEPDAAPLQPAGDERRREAHRRGRPRRRRARGAGEPHQRASRQSGVVRAGTVDVGGRDAVSQRRHPSRRADLQRAAAHLSLPEDRTLPGAVHEPGALPERLDVRIRERDGGAVEGTTDGNRTGRQVRRRGTTTILPCPRSSGSRTRARRRLSQDAGCPACSCGRAACSAAGPGFARHRPLPRSAIRLREGPGGCNRLRRRRAA